MGDAKIRAKANHAAFSIFHSRLVLLSSTIAIFSHHSSYLSSAERWAAPRAFLRIIPLSGTIAAFEWTSVPHELAILSEVIS
ncbi:hypothetical protein VTK73DRAFT_2932 [Phialemonium thermophilum]|uniref:Uncharacterized protein n=1 Tax=Phialemonium thermophilum TaxID=223376 RepID=A0ABR3VMC6_9PEZI